ncbi:MAG: outer membrane protein assembly factor BamE [Sulfuriferula sp.]
MTLQILVMRVLIILMSLLVGLFGLAGCSSLPSFSNLAKYNFLSPYKIDIQQGNDVTESKIDKLQIGMTRAQVQFIMGTTVLRDIFHANRWDYIYTMRHDGQLIANRRVTLFFVDDKLDRIVKHNMGDNAAPAPAAKGKA